jgi:Arc/MetJ family transcription regulator
MKRITVTVDEELLARARQMTGERTSSAVIQKALEEVVRAERMRKALDDSWNLGEIFSADWLEEKGYVKPRSRRISADEKRAPPANRRKA